MFLLLFSVCFENILTSPELLLFSVQNPACLFLVNANFHLGHSDGEDQLRPKQVENLQNFKVVDVACGSGDAQTLCITDNDAVWSWGDGDYGKLGRGWCYICDKPRAFLLQ